MDRQMRLLCSLILQITLLTQAKNIIEPCSTSDSCISLVSYVLPFDSKIAEIAYRFHVNITNVLAANNIEPTASPSQIFPAKSILKLPISCSCVDGIRRSESTKYIVKATDTIESISETFGGLVSVAQLKTVNGINNSMDPLSVGDTLVIPLPCTCFNNSDNGVSAVYMSYVVQRGQSLENIAMEFGTTVKDLEAVNELGQLAVDPGDILAVPISACSSANLNWYNESLVVPNGSYALTANNCIKCICGLDDLNLRCLPSGMVDSCSHLQCKGSDLFIGDTHVIHTPVGCNVSTCMYRGHFGRKIFRSLSNSSNVKCPSDENESAMAPRGSSPPMLPSIVISPSPFSLSPSLAPYPTMGINQDSNLSSTKKWLLNRAIYYSLLILVFLCFSLIL